MIIGKIVAVAFFGLFSALAMSSTPATPKEVKSENSSTPPADPDPPQLVCWQGESGGSCCCYQSSSGLYCSGGGCR